MFLASLPLAMAPVAISRLRRALLAASLWRSPERRREILPLPVSLTRLAVPLCVFSFGMLFTPYYYRQIAASHLGFLLNNGVFFELGDDFVDHPVAKFLVGHFAAAENNHDFDFVSVFEEAANLAELDLEVVATDFESQSHLFEFTGARILAVPLLFLHLLILVFAPVNDFGNRRRCVRRDLNQIKIGSFGLKERFSARQNT